MAGVLFQAILRNSLATPFTLGISAEVHSAPCVAIWLGLDPYGPQHIPSSRWRHSWAPS